MLEEFQFTKAKRNEPHLTKACKIVNLAGFERAKCKVGLSNDFNLQSTRRPNELQKIVQRSRHDMKT